MTTFDTTLPPKMTKRRGGAPSSSSNSKRRHERTVPPAPPQTTQQQLGGQQPQVVPVEFETCLRLRPLLKKERDDHIVLEPVPPSPTNKETSSFHTTSPHHFVSTTNRSSVALHPLPRLDNLAPSSALILQTLSPETIQTCHDVEFRFDHVFGPDDACHDDNAHVYTTLGRPMAHSVMEPLMMDDAMRKTHLVIAMGGPGSGKTYTCWGGGSQISKRKGSMDGLVPRMVDSLFGQFLRISNQQQQQKHHHHSHHSHSKQQQHTSVKQQLPSFAVNLSVLQLNQSKNSKQSSSSSSSSRDGGCKIHDLLQPVVSKATSALSPKIQTLVATFERSRSGSSQSSGGSSSHCSGHHSHHHSSSATAGNLDALISVEQDSTTHEFHVINGQVRTCKTAEQARDALQEAFSNGRKRASKRHQSHVLIQIQPIMLDSKTGKIVRHGGTICVLDMAATDDHGGNGLKPRLRTASKRIKDSLPNRNDAHSAILHCLRSIQFNEQIRAGGRGGSPKAAFSDKLDDGSSGDIMSDLSSCPSQEKSLHRHQSFKQVPYLQHALTMLLQPCFSPFRTDQTHVSILLTASPGHRDYREKKAIMTEVESFWTAKAPPAKQAMTGLPSVTKPSLQPSTSKQQQQQQPSLPAKPPSAGRKKQHQRCRSFAASDADDEQSVNGFGEIKWASSNERAPPTDDIFKSKFQPNAGYPGLENTHSMAYSDSSIEDNDHHYVPPMPPPIAPPLSTTFCRSNSRPQRIMSPDASAPPEEYVKPMVPPAVHCSTTSREGALPSMVSDFPGVTLPARGIDRLPPRQDVASSLSPASGSSGAQFNSSESLQEEAVATGTMTSCKASSSINSGALADDSGSSSTWNPHVNPSNIKFSAMKKNINMKNINKLVHASKKTCERVFEKMSTPASDNEQPLHPDNNTNTNNNMNDTSETKVLKQRIKQLEDQNANLARENKSLRHEKYLLREENEQLRAKTSVHPQQRGLREQNDSPKQQVLPSDKPSPTSATQAHDEKSRMFPLSPEKPMPNPDHGRSQQENDRFFALSPFKPTSTSPTHGRSQHENHHPLPLSPGRPMSSPESQKSLKENDEFAVLPPGGPRRDDIPESQRSLQNHHGPQALIPGKPLSSPRSHMKNGRLNILSPGKPVLSSDNDDEYESKFPSSSLQPSQLSCSNTYPSDNENVSPPGTSGPPGICMPGEDRKYILTEDKLKHPPTSPTSPMGGIGRRRDDYTITDPLMQHIANLSGQGSTTGATTTLWSSSGAAASGTGMRSHTSSTLMSSSSSNDNSNSSFGTTSTLGSFSSNYKSTLSRWQS